MENHESNVPGWWDGLFSGASKAFSNSLVNTISKLVGGIVKVPLAWFDSKAQGITSKADNQALVDKAIAKAAAKEIAGDAALMERAKDYFSGKYYSQQENREKVARRTIELIAVEAGAEQLNSEVDEDWMTRFSTIVEDISNEAVQDMWARLLAGEIKRPKSFSLRTLEVLRSLSAVEAASFSKLRKLAVRTKHGLYLPFMKEAPSFGVKEFISREEMDMLQEAGILFHAGSYVDNLSIISTEDFFIIGDSVLRFAEPTHLVHKEFLGRDKYRFVAQALNPGIKRKHLLHGIASFTKVGEELFSLIEGHLNEPEIEYLQFWLKDYRVAPDEVKYTKVISFDGKTVKYDESTLENVPLHETDNEPSRQIHR